MANSWHELTNFESRDLVFEAYQRKHCREPNASRIKEITANFIQARAYFESASRAAITVKPLLQYYGVASLTKGLILTVSSSKGAEALKPSHGLKPQNWGATLTTGLGAFGELSVKINKGTFYELLEVTGNSSYLKEQSIPVNLKIKFPMPRYGEVFSISDIAACMPEVASDYEIWAGTPLVSADIISFKHNKQTKRFEFSFLSDTKAEIIQEFFSETRDVVETPYGKRKISIPDSYHPFFGQILDRVRGFGSIHLVKPIRGSIYLNNLGLYFGASYILGMVVRYFPAVWISLGRQEKGDRIAPLVRRLVTLIQDRFPQIVLDFLKSPYEFETNEPTT